MKRSENLIINGSGSYPGGRYDKISIRGEGTIVNDVESLLSMYMARVKLSKMSKQAR